MKKILSTFLLALVLCLGVAGFVDAKVNVRGYIRKNGTYVAPHSRSNPDRNSYNNWSTRGNINPYTFKIGTKAPKYNLWGY